MEILSPAGNLEKLKTAINYGADAVYCGAGSYSLRAPSTSFSLEELAEGIDYAHTRKRRIYLALNIFPFDEDIIAIKKYLLDAAALGIDAVIISDPGVLKVICDLKLKVNVHLSTQANTTNSESVAFWADHGVSRIVLARELSLEQVKSIRDQVPNVELEIFGHGAMCIAYSGRCLLSSYFNGRSANRGLCTQPCRWEYTIREAGRSEEIMISEDERGTYLLNSRDLCMIEYIPEIVSAGVDSIKIEGRMKSSYYAALTAKIYREAIDSFLQNKNNYSFEPLWLKELEKLSHRPFTTGFYITGSDGEKEHTEDSAYIRGYNFVGMVEDYDAGADRIIVNARNRIRKGDSLEIIDPSHREALSFSILEITNLKTGETISEAHNSYLIEIKADRAIAESLIKNAVIRSKAN